MRERLIKPDFTKDEDIPLLSRDARLFYVLLWMYLDRKGRCEDRPLRIRAELFPYEPEVDVEPWLNELATTQKRVGHGTFIVRYKEGGVGYIEAPKFEQHQRFHPKERPSQIPPSASSINGSENARPAAEGCGQPRNSAASNTNSILAARLHPGPSVPSGPSGPSNGLPPQTPPPVGGGVDREIVPMTRSGADRAIQRIVSITAPFGAHRFDRRFRRALRDRLLGGEPEDEIIASLEAEARESEERERRARPYPGFVEKVMAGMSGPPAHVPAEKLLADIKGQAPPNGDSGPPQEPEADAGRHPSLLPDEDAWEPVLPEAAQEEVPPEDVGSDESAIAEQERDDREGAVDAFLSDFPGIDIESAKELWDSWAIERGLIEDNRTAWREALLRRIAALGGPGP